MDNKYYSDWIDSFKFMECEWHRFNLSCFVYILPRFPHGRSKSKSRRYWKFKIEHFFDVFYIDILILMKCCFRTVLNKGSYIYSRVCITSSLCLCNSEFHARAIFKPSRSYIIFLLPKSKKRKHKISINNTRY